MEKLARLNRKSGLVFDNRLCSLLRCGARTTTFALNMNHTCLLLGLAILAGSTLGVLGADKPAKATALLHVVSFRFKDTTTKEQIKAVEDAFRDLKKKIPQIKDYQWGTNVSPEKHDKGFTHGFVLRFQSEQDRDDYLVHPDHKAFGKLVGPVLADVFVIDFWAQP